ncbi:MAG: hypothetical protein KDA89_20615 [Planctomycetaceae bacterium]|nr:hypothetical protein [Planctomycetaceae bacterium]
MSQQTRLQEDLRSVFHSFPLSCLYHLRANSHRLVRGTYRDAKGRGCIMYLLSETLPAVNRIDSKPALVSYFAEGKGDESPEYQPAKWIVRLWDNSICRSVLERYGPNPRLETEELLNVLDQVIAEREVINRPDREERYFIPDVPALVAV